MPKSKSKPKPEENTPTLFDLSTVASKQKSIHPDDLDTDGSDFPGRRPCNHSKKKASATGWICLDCFKRWEDVGEDWAIARLQSLKKIREQYEGKLGKHFKEAIVDIDKESEEITALYFSSPVVLPLYSSDTTGEPTGERLYQWVEEYLKKGRTYLRYCYSPSHISPAKKIHIRGGDSTSSKAIARREMIEAAIVNGKSPPEIIAILKDFK